MHVHTHTHTHTHTCSRGVARKLQACIAASHVPIVLDCTLMITHIPLTLRVRVPQVECAVPNDILQNAHLTIPDFNNVLTYQETLTVQCNDDYWAASAVPCRNSFTIECTGTRALSGVDYCVRGVYPNIGDAIQSLSPDPVETGIPLERGYELFFFLNVDVCIREYPGIGTHKVV
jgi:hypothetical protein